MATDLLQSGLTWLKGKRTAHMSREVIYRRGAEEQTVDATIGRSSFQDVEVNNILQRVEVRDYLIATDDLDLGEPLAGDIIADGTTTWMVASPGLGIPAWEHEGRGQTLRIHTKAQEVDAS